MGEKAEGTKRTEKTVQSNNKTLSAKRKAEVDEATIPSNGEISWSAYIPELEEQVEVSHKSNGKSKSRKK